MFIDEASGRVRSTDSLVQISGVGVLGVRTMYDDFRDVGGMQLPFRSVSTFANPLIASTVAVLEEAKTGFR